MPENRPTFRVIECYRDVRSGRVASHTAQISFPPVVSVGEPRLRADASSRSTGRRRRRRTNSGKPPRRFYIWQCYYLFCFVSKYSLLILFLSYSPIFYSLHPKLPVVLVFQGNFNKLFLLLPLVKFVFSPSHFVKEFFPYGYDPNDNGYRRNRH